MPNRDGSWSGNHCWKVRKLTVFSRSAGTDR